MFGGIDPKKMQQMMKQMGIKQEEVDALRVVIDKVDGGKTVIDNPSVVKIVMSGQESWQISGEAREESGDNFSDEDVKLVMGKTGKSEKEVRDVLGECGGDIAEAIVKLS
ncbi:MAG: nascent polypeptide-associated complex protein [Nanoarchaeota archaeon]